MHADHIPSMRIFIAEDDPWYAGMLEHHLRMNPDYTVETFSTGTALLQRLEEGPDVVTLDYQLPDGKADKLLASIRAQYPDLPVIIISGQDDIGTAVQLIKEGATEYLVKSEETRQRLWRLLSQLQASRSAGQAPSAKTASTTQRQMSVGRTLIGRSKGMQRVALLIQKAAQSNIVVSISGETGTGKELVARAIHESSHQAQQPFVAVNLAAIPEGLVESELFGAEKGAYTGAQERRIGKFELAASGTLFLDEVGEMDLALQAKLLRVLQERHFSRLGSNKELRLAARIMVATHKDLAREVAEGRFREDLYYRLLGLPIQLPPLRERAGDIALIAQATLDEALEDGSLDARPEFHPEALEMLEAYAFPGNVRELKAMVLLAAVMGDGQCIKATDLQFQAVRSKTEFLDREMTLKEYNAKIIRHYLSKYNDNVVAVAKKLGVGKSTIYRMLKQNQLGS